MSTDDEKDLAVARSTGMNINKVRETRLKAMALRQGPEKRDAGQYAAQPTAAPVQEFSPTAGSPQLQKRMRDVGAF